MTFPSEKAGWRFYPTDNHPVFPYAEGFYQKRLVQLEGDGEYLAAEIIQYPAFDWTGPSWEVEVNIPGEVWTKIKLYTYKELDFEKMEADARELILRFKDKFKEI